MPRKVFTAGEILTAANLNDVSDATVMVFDDAAARTTAIPTPVEGMVTYLKDTDAVEKFDGSNFVAVGVPPAILQVVSANKIDAFATTSTSLVDVPDFSVSITPSSTSSKVLVTVALHCNTRGSVPMGIQLLRDSTALNVGTAVGTRAARTASFGSDQFPGAPVSIVFLDSPNTTASVTYKCQINAFSGTVAVNTQSEDADAASRVRSSSTITVMEVAG